LDLSDENFKIPLINMYKNREEKIENFSRDLESIEVNEYFRYENTIYEIKNSIYWFYSKLDTADHTIRRLSQ